MKIIEKILELLNALFFLHKHSDLNLDFRIFNLNDQEAMGECEDTIKELNNLYPTWKRAQAESPGIYRATGEWEWIYRDTDFNVCNTLPQLFLQNDLVYWGNNFSAKRLANPFSIVGKIKKILISYYSLRDYLIWKILVNSKVDELAHPKNIGCPWGLTIDNKLIMSGAFRNHYFATYCKELLTLKTLQGARGGGVVLEIGGGYGEFAYRLMSMANDIKYIGIDLPDTLVRCAYFLKKALPTKRIKMIEANQDLSDLSEYDIVLVPNYLLPFLNEMSADIVVNLRSLSEMSKDTVLEYLKQIDRVCKRYFVSENTSVVITTPDGHQEINSNSFILKNFEKKFIKKSPWLGGGADGGRYIEILYERFDIR